MDAARRRIVSPAELSVSHDPSESPNASRAVPGSLRRRFTWQNAKEQAIAWVLFGCALLSVLTTVSIIFVLLSESVVAIPPHTSFFQDVSVWEFFTETRWTPQYHDQHFGILPLLCGTLLITGLSALVGLPAGLFCAVYLSEYASPANRTWIKPVLELLAGVPTVVYGYFGLVFLTPMVLKPLFYGMLGLTVDSTNALCGGLVVGLMIIPTVASLSEDVLRAVPGSLRESGYALGATKFDVSTKIVVPSALSGILASFLLALSRGIGETMAVTICASGSPQLTLNPLRQIQTMTSFIVNVMSGDAVEGTKVYKSLYAVALVLFVMTLFMNIVSQMILRRYREVYQ